MSSDEQAGSNADIFQGTGRSDIIESNLFGYLSFIPRHCHGMSVDDRGDYLMIDTRLNARRFNVISRAAFSPECAGERIAHALSYFHGVGREFEWWVGPSSRPLDLLSRLDIAGLSSANPEPGMSLDLSAPQVVIEAPKGFSVIRVRTTSHMGDFIAIASIAFAPVEPEFAKFFLAALPLVINPDCQLSLYVAYLKTQPVSALAVYIQDGVAGLYSVGTPPSLRQRGFASVLVSSILMQLRASGTGMVTLQASRQGLRLYERLGFREECRFVVYRQD